MCEPEPQLEMHGMVAALRRVIGIGIIRTI